MVPNQEALDWAYQCCRTVFPETKPTEWGVNASDSPSTGSYCFIDLVHNTTALDFEFVPAKDRPDVFGPFIRVTNSYNGLRALTFNIGFYRKVCQNGLILPKSIIRFTFTHLRKDIGETIRFVIDHERLAKFKESFNEYLKALRECTVPRSEFEPFFCGVLLIHKPKEPESPIAMEWDTLSKHLGILFDRYVEDLGENAYALFNAMTEFASHPLENRCVHRDRHSFQRLAGDWLSKFSQECLHPDFVLSVYLEKLAKTNGNGKISSAEQQSRGH
jgi:hypothetical protein